MRPTKPLQVQALKNLGSPHKGLAKPLDRVGKPWGRLWPGKLGRLGGPAALEAEQGQNTWTGTRFGKA